MSNEPFDKKMTENKSRISVGTDDKSTISYDQNEGQVLSPHPAHASTTEDSLARESTHNAMQTAKKAGRKLRSGFTAVRDVRAATKRHNTAKQELKTMQATLDADSAELKRRDNVMTSYTQIVQEETAELNEATELAESLRARKVKLAEERAQLQADLAREKSDNEQALRPYKQLFDTARGRSEDASRAVGEAKRNVKTQEAKVSEAQHRRTQSIASANRELDNSQERLRRMEDELAKLTSEANPEQSSISSLELDIAAENARVDAARTKISSVTSELQAEVDQENERLFAIKRTLDQATSDAEAAKQEFEERKNEYDRLSHEASAREQAIQTEIDNRTQAIATTETEIAAAEARIRDAQAILDDANDIHDHPEATEALRASVNSQENAIDEQGERIAKLASSERELRQSTRGNRIAFFAVAIAVVLIIILILVLVFTSGN